MEIKYNNPPYIKQPTRYKSGWFDIYTPKEYRYKAGEIVKVDFELIMDMPIGYEAIIAPRSSTIERYGLIHSGIGIIDNEYRGKNDKIGCRFYAIKDGVIPANTAICQMKIVKNMPHEFYFKYQAFCLFSDVDRGGFGSTDSKDVSDFEDGYQVGYREGYDSGFISGLEHFENKIKR